MENYLVDYFILIICLAKLCGDLGVLADCDTEPQLTVSHYPSQWS